MKKHLPIILLSLAMCLTWLVSCGQNPAVPSVVPSTIVENTPSVTPTEVPVNTPESTKTPEPTEVAAATPEATETPIATPEATETPIATPEVTETPIATPEVTETPLPTEPAVNETPTPAEATKAPTNTPAPTATKAPTNTPAPTATKAPTNTPAPTATKAPTNTPLPTATPTPTEIPFIVPTGLSAAQVASECAKLSPTWENVDKAVQIVVQNLIKPGMADHEKARVIHDYIVEYTVYDIENYNHGTIPNESYNPIGCLILHKCVCDGYAQAYQRIMNAAGVECIKVTGEAIHTPVSHGGYYTGNSNHAWNMVKLENEWYYVDTTWDDPVSVLGNGTIYQSPETIYTYFLIPSQIMSDDHKDMYATGGELHTCSSYKYYEYYREKIFEERYPNAIKVENLDTLCQQIAELLDKGEKEVVIWWDDKEEYVDMWNNVVHKLFESGEYSNISSTSRSGWGRSITTLMPTRIKDQIRSQYPDAEEVKSYTELEELVLSKYNSGIKELVVFWNQNAEIDTWDAIRTLDESMMINHSFRVYGETVYSDRCYLSTIKMMDTEEYKALYRQDIVKEFGKAAVYTNQAEAEAAISAFAAAGENEFAICYEKGDEEFADWRIPEMAIEETGCSENYRIDYSTQRGPYYVFKIVRK